MSNIAIRVENLSKQYRIGGKQERYKTLRDTLTDAIAAPFRRAGRLLRGQATSAAELNETIWALKEISCEVKHGEVVGIVGRNGAGKSTLLKILSRITEPTEGFAEIHGRVGSLLEVGTGFHPELTGRENIYLSGAILGMRRAEIERKFDEIVAFTEVEKFIDTPVKHYSSGMYLRLAFAVAAHLEPEILLVDEVLAVGDAAFQKKCLGKMENVAKEGRTVLFVSHHMGSVASLSTKGIFLEQGRIQCFSDINSVIDAYSHSLKQGNFFVKRTAGSTAYIESAQIVSSGSIETDQTLTFEVCVFSKGVLDTSLNWRLKNEFGMPLSFGCPHVQLGKTYRLKAGINRFLITIGPLPLAEGDYTISLDLDIPWIEYMDRIEDCLQFSVLSCILGSKGHSLKTAWRIGSVIFPFEIHPVE